MKVLFIKPKIEKYNRLVPPIHFLYLASHLKHKVKVIDGNIDKIKDEDIIKFNPNIIGFSGTSSEIDYSLKLAKRLKGLVNAKIVFGGVHVTNRPYEILKEDYIDFIFRAEAEIPFAEFVDKLEREENYTEVPNLGYKKNGKIFLNEVKLYDFNMVNIPRWDLIDLKKYPPSHTNKKMPFAIIFTSRGCPYSCTFCSAFTMSGKKFRTRNIDKIIEELEYLKRKFGIKEFQIWDDNFTLHKERAIDFCNSLIKKKINLVWGCPNGVRIETLDDELLKRMKEAGCWMMSLPIEFGTQRMLDITKKQTILKQILKIVPLVEKNGIQATGFFIMGHPEEKEEEMNETVRLSKTLPISRADFNVCKLLIGSEDYEKYCTGNSKLLYWEGGNKKLRKLQKYALFSFHLRPKQILGIIQNLSLGKIKELVRISKRFI